MGKKFPEVVGVFLTEDWMEGYVFSLDFKDQFVWSSTMLDLIFTPSQQRLHSQFLFIYLFFCKHKTREVFTLTYSHVMRAVTLLIE